MDKYIEIKWDGNKQYIDPKEIVGIIDMYRGIKIYLRGVPEPIYTYDSLEKLMTKMGMPQKETEVEGEFRVGDEVTANGWLGKFVVIKNTERRVHVLSEVGGEYDFRSPCLQKTGRHFEGFEEVAESLGKAMDEWKGAKE